MGSTASEDVKKKWVWATMIFLDWYQEKDEFLNYIVAEDDIWVPHETSKTCSNKWNSIIQNLCQKK